MRDPSTKEYTVVATRPIQPGENIGECLGKWRLIPAKRYNQEPNQGYALQLCQILTAGSAWRVCVEALSCGGLMRNLNHSCRPAARFHAVSNLRSHTVIVAVIDAIAEGSEITVDYGDVLWFRCRCGNGECIHRDVDDEGQAFATRDADFENSFAATSSQSSGSVSAILKKAST